MLLDALLAMLLVVLPNLLLCVPLAMLRTMLHAAALAALLYRCTPPPSPHSCLALASPGPPRLDLASPSMP